MKMENKKYLGKNLDGSTMFANIAVSYKPNRGIEARNILISAANASWTKYFKECETLKQELLRYKELVKVQSAIINNN